jgi:transposase
MKLLIYSRILFPASKNSTYENKESYFEKSGFSLDDVYRCLGFVNKLKEKVQRHIHRKVSEKYGRKCELIYYDVTNYYFDIDEQDRLRRLGVSKEHRANPIVQMGLFVDIKGIPISYKLFPGNTNDCETLRPLLSEMRREFDMGRVVVVADRGINTQNNIQSNILNSEGYVYSQTVRGGHRELKEYILEDKGYRPHGSEGKIKSRIYPRELSVTDIEGKVKKVRIDEKQVVFYSELYAMRSRTEREGVLLKAHELVDNPSKYNKATSYGAAKYVKNLEFDDKTGEIRTSKVYPVFNEAKLREEEKFDGYYCIVTSELDKSDDEIISIYKGLWRIEEAFRVSKSTLETRPVYLSREDHIEAHFLVCFIALCLARILQYRVDYRYSIAAIADSLKKASCAYLEGNIYIFDYIDPILQDIGKTLGIDFSRKYLQLGEIKRILGATKK